MAFRKNEVLKIIQNLISALKQNNITISEAYLFGSYAEDKYDEYSDIDLALVSDDFSGILYHDLKKIGKIVRNIDYRIEVHPFSLHQEKNSLFLQEIKLKGIKVA
jgi:predicted nucleotidyltransferase